MIVSLEGATAFDFGLLTLADGRHVLLLAVAPAQALPPGAVVDGVATYAANGAALTLPLSPLPDTTGAVLETDAQAIQWLPEPTSPAPDAPPPAKPARSPKPPLAPDVPPAPEPPPSPAADAPHAMSLGDGAGGATE